MKTLEIFFLNIYKTFLFIFKYFILSRKLKNLKYFFVYDIIRQVLIN
ncbi:hypothetical protein HMPREF9015_00895 [Leptotrichia wadei F0279]|uniref:Uncharacterized protein n=1 Tax=Leptotrichia wadei (strain F0279) TaxID=888055 RepID=U2Q819_LEPWF|nr:hypothetical protein HMPREF9015_00895 [Leptotrichia wadei F0279]